MSYGAAGTRECKGKTPSCDFCRTRKLRCNRPLPCTSCTSRGIVCQFGASTVSSPSASRKRKSQASSPPATRPPSQSTTLLHRNPEDRHLLEEIEALKELTGSLEARILQRGAAFPVEDGKVATLRRPDEFSLSYDGELDNAVAYLERLSMGKSQAPSVMIEEVALKVECLQAIHRAPSHICISSRAVRCIWLPQAAETKLLVNIYLERIVRLTPVVHGPSVVAMVDTIYQQVHARQRVPIGNAVLLLSILATVTHVWDNQFVRSKQSPFDTSEDAHAQTPQWISAAYAALRAGQSYGTASLAIVQGLCIMSFLVWNLEGVSLRYRSLISSGLLLSREIGLHRMDERTSAQKLETIHTQTRRCVWWWLVTTDWLMAARYGGSWEGIYVTHPQHMLVNKPRQIKEYDAISSDSDVGSPLINSYYYQRLRLADISRNIGDAFCTAAIQGQSIDYRQIIEADAEIEAIINDWPSFLRIESYEHAHGATSDPWWTQAYMVSSLLQTLRCKLHFSYLKITFNRGASASHSFSKCLQAARDILRAEAIAINASQEFCSMRARLPAALYGLFLASIVFLSDMCLNSPATVQSSTATVEHADLARALHMIEGMKDCSLAAANLHSSILKIIERQRTQYSRTLPGSQPSTTVTPPLSLSQDTQEVNMNDWLDFSEAALDDLFAELDASSVYPSV